MNVKEYVEYKTRLLSKLREYLLKDNLTKKVLCENNKFNTYYINQGNVKDTVITIKSDYFFKEYYEKYIYLYPDITYYIWYKRLYKRGKSRMISKNKRYTIYSRDNCKCVMCGCDNIYSLTIDHIYPHSQTKDNSYYNLATLCDECNNLKGDRFHISKIIMDKIINNAKSNN